jgi:cation transport ATPase
LPKSAAPACLLLLAISCAAFVIRKQRTWTWIRNLATLVFHTSQLVVFLMLAGLWLDRIRGRTKPV